MQNLLQLLMYCAGREFLDLRNIFVIVTFGWTRRGGAPVVPDKLTFECTCVIVIIIMKTRDNERMGWKPLFRPRVTKEQRHTE
jgi:hypothetical protein